MSDFSDYSEDKILNVLFRAASHTGAAAVYMALFTANPTDAGGGTECTYASYARQSITFGAPSAGAIANTNTLTYAAVAGGAITVTGVAIFDASTGGNMLGWKALGASIAYNNTDIPQFAVGGITFTAA
jgi:hypothetical protein